MTRKFELELSKVQLEVLQLALQNSMFDWVETMKTEATDFVPHDVFDEANISANAANLIAAYELREIFGRTQ